MRFPVLVAVGLLALAGCGGGDGSSAPPPAAPAPPVVPPPPPPPTIGANGGTVTETSGAAIVVPAGAITTDTTFRIAMDSTGAPPVPAELGAIGNMYVITPHGGEFAQPVEVRIPAPAVTLQPNQLLKLAKAAPAGEWTILEDSTVVDGKLTAQVGDFSFFTAVVVTYPLPIAQAEPLQLTTSLTCAEGNCSHMVGDVSATFTVVGNNGQLPQNCQNGSLFIGRAYGYSSSWVTGPLRSPIPRTGGSLAATVQRIASNSYTFGVGTLCGNYRSSFGSNLERRISWPSMPEFPEIRVVNAPSQLDVVEGMPANLDILVMGGAFRIVDSVEVYPSRVDRAVIDWQRSDDGGASWRTVATSFQNEANALPAGTGLAWRPWRVRHGFTATATDQGALIRVQACYSPPAPTVAPPCATWAATRINVIQQSDLPSILTAPRSVLIRNGETANFSVSASGAPLPALQWQWRPANSTGAWTNVTTGSGATTADYTTGPRGPSNNGEQYRVVATNAVGSAESAPVTISVSDLDVAPSITTQPASLSVVAGGDAVFAVDAYGTEALSYQWQRNGTDIAGANSPVLRLNGVTSASAGAYTLSVTNNAGSAMSNVASLTVTASAPAAVAPTIVTQPTAVTVNAGNTATLAVGVAGTGPLTFQWRRDGVDMDGATSAVLTFNVVGLPNAGSYSVRVANSAGEVVSNSVLLDVLAAGAPVAPAISSQPATLIVPLDGSGVIAVGATGSGPLAYQWYLNGQLLPGATLPVLNFSHLGSVDFGSYTVTVTNSVASVTSQSANLIMLGAPAITQQPAATSVLEGQNATFFVQASGSGLRYQWSVNGVPIPGAIGATFNTPPLVAANSGAVYSVLVYNGAGHVFSQGAVLTVQTLVAPSIIQQPVSSTLAAGLQAEMCLTIGGTPTFDVLLQRWNGVAWVSGASVLVNDNGNHCYFTDVLAQPDDGAQFRFLVQNPAGQATSNTATVTVQTVQPPAVTQTTLVSEASIGGPPNNTSGEPSMSANGNLIAFVSLGTNLHVDAPSNVGHAYVRDMATDTTRLIDYTLDGDEPAFGVSEVKLSSNGRYAIFTSRAGDLVAGDTNNAMDVFRRDLLTGTTERLSLLPNGDQLPFGVGGNADYQIDISADGRIVMFRCAYDIGPGGAGADNGNFFLYYRDVQLGATGLVAGSPSYGVAYSALSDDGQWIAYAYGIPAPADQTVQLVDIGAHSEIELFRFSQTTGEYLHQGMSISSNGRYVAFSIVSPGITGSAFSQVVVRDREDPNSLDIASRNSGVPGNGDSAWPDISGDGRYVLFSSLAPSLTNNLALPNHPYVIVGDIVGSIVTIASTRQSDGAPVVAGTFVNGNHALSEDGGTLAFVPDTVNMAMGTFGEQVFAAPRP